MIVIEELNIKSFLLILKINSKKKVNIVKYIYEPQNLIKFIFLPILRVVFFFLKINFTKLEFKMIDIRDKNNNFSRFKIFEDQFDLEKKFYEYYDLREIGNSIFFKNYILKRIFTDEITFHRYCFSRTQYIIKVLEHINHNENIIFDYLILIERPWKKLINYYLNQNLNIKTIYIYSYKINEILNLLIKNFKLNIKNFLRRFSFNKIRFERNSFNLFCEGENHPNLEVKGERSDFFWLINSSFQKKT